VYLPHSSWALVFVDSVWTLDVPLEILTYLVSCCALMHLGGLVTVISASPTSGTTVSPSPPSFTAELLCTIVVLNWWF
jgi:hypothetical protein